MSPNLLKLFADARSILIVISKNAKIDGLAASLAFSIAAITQGKTVYVCSEALLPEGKNLAGYDKVATTLQLGGNILKVAFPYQEGAIDKVTYNITDDKFNLLIEPRQGQAALTANNVQFSYTGGAVDVIITIDAPNLESLGNIYLENPDIFLHEKIVNIDRRFDNKNYGVENLVDKQSSSTSEIVVRLLQGLRWEINPDSATDLYAGLSAATNNFTSFSTNAQSFEVASYLLKQGARKIAMVGKPQSSFNQPNPFGNLSATGQGDNMFLEDESAFLQDPFTVPPTRPAMPVRQQTQGTVQQAQPQPRATAATPINKSQDKTPPQDWLKPKIFKSTDLV